MKEDERYGEKTLRKLLLPRAWGIAAAAALVLTVISAAISVVSGARVAPEPRPLHSVESAEAYCFADAALITDYLAYTDEERYYAVCDTAGAWRIVILTDTDFDDKFADIYRYTVLSSDDVLRPASVKITGITENIPEDIYPIIRSAFGLSSAAEAEKIFGGVLLNTKRDYVSTAESVSLVLSVVCGAALLFCAAGFLLRIGQRNKCIAYLQKTGETENACRQTASGVGQSYGSMKLVGGFVYNRKNAVLLKLSDIIWIFKRVKRYNFTKYGACLIAYTPIGEVDIMDYPTGKNSADPAPEVIAALQSASPDMFIGYTLENKMLASQKAEEMREGTVTA